MHYKKLLIILVFISFLFNCKEETKLVTDVSIIPQPLDQINKEGVFILDDSVSLSYTENLEDIVSMFSVYVEKNLGFQFNKQRIEKQITFGYNTEIENEEGYILDITTNEILIQFRSPKGAFYAIQTLRQLLPESFENGTFKGENISIPCTVIEDEPQFKYRGMHLDVGRHMFSVEFIKKYIDALAMLKMNTFHWHLTEDQGWRIEIKKYPKLQEIASFRNETLVGHYNDEPQQFDGKTYGGYYTQKDIKDIVAYAKARQITIIPEIELPGHSKAAIAAYPELGCTGKQVEVATKWGVFEDIYCPKEETFTFIENVLDEVLELFPSTYIHIGGDEAPKTRWKNCNHCQELIKKEGLKDEHELQSYFITRIESYLNKKGRQIIGWDEILEGGLAPNATVMSWRGTQGAIEAAKQQHNVILTPGSHCYFDHYQSENENEPLAIGGFLPLEKVYSFYPIPEELTSDESKYVLGAQGNVWTEYMPTETQVEYMVFPRILAMSEVVWSNPKLKNYENFILRVEHFNKRLNALNINYANHLYEIEGKLISHEKQLSYQLKTPTEGKFIRYTLDGSNPTTSSIVYENSIPITESSTIKAAVFNSKEKLGETFSQDINLHKAVGKKITINKEPHKSYPGSGADGLINGISGSNSRYGDKEWLGFWGEDIEITIDLGEKVEINSVETRFYNATGQWIYAPPEVEIKFDNSEKSELFKLNPESKIIAPIKLNFQSINSRSIKLKIPNYGIIKEGKQGAGNKAWTFIDEIIVK